MSRHKYYILDADGYILLTVISQPTNRDADKEAELSISPLLPVIARQYGLERVFYTVTEACKRDVVRLQTPKYYNEKHFSILGGEVTE